MKKEFLLGILGLAVVVLFIAGCTPVQRLYVCPDGSQVLDPTACPLPGEETGTGEEPEVIIPEPEEEEEPVVEEEEEGVYYPVEISDDAQALFDKNKNVQILKFIYVKVGSLLPEHIYYASREKMRITLKTRKFIDDDEAYDNVYLDLVEKTATAYCENRVRQICPDRDKPLKVSYEDYIIDTPFTWVGRLTKAELTGRSERIDDRNAVEVSFEIRGKPGTMFVDSFFGVPMEINFEGNEYLYKDMTINIEKLTTLEHQFGE